MEGNKEHVLSIFSLTKESSYNGSVDKDEHFPLLSGCSINVENREEVKEEKEQPKQKDFQTIRVPRSGQAVREYYTHVDTCR